MQRIAVPGLSVNSKIKKINDYMQYFHGTVTYKNKFRGLKLKH